MRPIGALDEGVKLAWPVDIVGVIALAAEKADVFLAANGCTYAFEAHGRYLPFLQAARLFGRFGVHQRMSGGDRLDDVVVTGAAAEIAFEAFTDFLLGQAVGM